MESKAPTINIIAAIGKNRVIGKDNELIWSIPEDLKRFKQLTLGHPVVMGRKTFESIYKKLGRPLPGRTNIVATRNPTWHHEGVITAHSLEAAVAAAKEVDASEIFIAGGAEIYEQALPLADKLHMTLVGAEEIGDAYFPPYEHLFTKKVFDEEHIHSDLTYRWVDFEK